MRGPDIILREGFDAEGVTMKKKKKKGNVQNVLGENSDTGALKWVVAGLGAGERSLLSFFISRLTCGRCYTSTSVDRVIRQGVSHRFLPSRI